MRIVPYSTRKPRSSNISFNMRHVLIAAGVLVIGFLPASGMAKKDPFHKEFPMINVLETEHGIIQLTDDQAGAIEELNTRNIPFTEDEFIDAVKRGDVDLVKIFIRGGMSPNTRVETDWPAMLIAAQRGYADVVGVLADGKAFVNLRNSQGWTPLLLATLLSKNDVAKMLVEKGADLELATQYGVTPLMLAVQENDTELAAYFLKKGANPRVKSDFGANAANIAVENAKDDMLKVFTKAGLKDLIDETRATVKAEKKNTTKKFAEEVKARHEAAPNEVRRIQ